MGDDGEESESIDVEAPQVGHVLPWCSQIVAIEAATIVEGLCCLPKTVEVPWVELGQATCERPDVARPEGGVVLAAFDHRSEPLASPAVYPLLISVFESIADLTMVWSCGPKILNASPGRTQRGRSDLQRAS